MRPARSASAAKLFSSKNISARDERRRALREVEDARHLIREHQAGRQDRVEAAGDDARTGPASRACSCGTRSQVGGGHFGMAADLVGGAFREPPAEVEHHRRGCTRASRSSCRARRAARRTTARRGCGRTPTPGSRSRSRPVPTSARPAACTCGLSTIARASLEQPDLTDGQPAGPLAGQLGRGRRARGLPAPARGGGCSTRLRHGERSRSATIPPPPPRHSTATIRLSSTVRWLKGCCFWKVRRSPCRARQVAVRPVMSVPSKTHPAGGRVLDAGNDVEQRRLAGAVRTDQPADLTARDGDGHVIERRARRRTSCRSTWLRARESVPGAADCSQGCSRDQMARSWERSSSVRIRKQPRGGRPSCGAPGRYRSWGSRTCRAVRSCEPVSSIGAGPTPKTS